MQVQTGGRTFSCGKLKNSAKLLAPKTTIKLDKTVKSNHFRTPEKQPKPNNKFKSIYLWKIVELWVRTVGVSGMLLWAAPHLPPMPPPRHSPCCSCTWTGLATKNNQRLHCQRPWCDLKRRAKTTYPVVLRVKALNPTGEEQRKPTALLAQGCCPSWEEEETNRNQGE